MLPLISNSVEWSLHQWQRREPKVAAPARYRAHSARISLERVPAEISCGAPHVRSPQIGARRDVRRALCVQTRIARLLVHTPDHATEVAVAYEGGSAKLDF